MSGGDLTSKLCSPDPSRGIDYYLARLSGIMKFVGASLRRSRSTHAYTKEIRRSLESLVYHYWDRREEMIPIIARSMVPEELASRDARSCFTMLLESLLREFSEKAKDLSIGSRIELVNILIAALAEMARGELPPEGQEVYKVLFERGREGGEKR